MSRAAILLCVLFAAAAAAAPSAPAPAPGAPRPELDKGVLLIASNNVQDPNFRHSVVLITRYDEHGTMGVILNRPLELPASEALPPLQGVKPDPGRLYAGGPVALETLQLLIENRGKADGTLNPVTQVFGQVHMVQDAGVLESLRSGRVIAARLRLFAGYAGWAAGQLETELLRGDWYLYPADAGTVFTASPERVWGELMERVRGRWALRKALPEEIPAGVL